MSDAVIIANSHDKDGNKVDIKCKILMIFYDEIDNLGL